MTSPNNSSNISGLSPFLKAVANDNSFKISSDAVNLWLKDLNNPLRWILRPLLQFLFSVLLHVIWFLKRLPLPQFRAHNFLQKMICWFCRNFVSPEANALILRHYTTETNLLNFIRDNTPGAESVEPVKLYPKTIDDMLVASFVEHDQELFRFMSEVPHANNQAVLKSFNWTHWQEMDKSIADQPKKWSQVLDFETSHALFMCLFCLLLTAEEYRDAINGFNLDHSIAKRIGDLVGDPTLPELAYNKFPLYLVGPWNLSQRFLMHGFFTEYVHEYLDRIRQEQI